LDSENSKEISTRNELDEKGPGKRLGEGGNAKNTSDSKEK